MLTKKKRKLRAPLASLSTKAFLLTTPSFGNSTNETPNRGSHSHSLSLTSSNTNTNTHTQNTSHSSSMLPSLNRHSLTYTPMTRKLMQKQQRFVCNHAYEPIPAIALTKSSFPTLIISDKNCKKAQSKKKRKYSELITNSNSNWNESQSQRKKKKRRLNNNNNKSIAKSDSSLTQNILNFGSAKKNESKSKSKSQNLISRRRRKRHSFSSNAIKKSVSKKQKKREISPFETQIPTNVKKTYKKRVRKVTKNKKIQKKKPIIIKNICPLLTELIKNERNKQSLIAQISKQCFLSLLNQIEPNQRNILRKFDAFLSLYARAELILTNFNAQMSGKQRVHFCSFDLSTIETPIFGELESIKHSQNICRLLVQSALISAKVFRIKSDKSVTRKCIALVIAELRQMKAKKRNNKNSNHCKALQYLISEFENGYSHSIPYPFCDKTNNLLSSLIRFYLKTIWNASEFLVHSHSPKWYSQLGTFTLTNPNLSSQSQTEFIPYHASELGLNLESLFYLKNAMAKNSTAKDCSQIMAELGIADNPFTFFSEMRQVLRSIGRESIYGNPNRGEQTEFDKYLHSKWKELKLCLSDVQRTNATRLYFYLPLLDFKRFLNSIQQDCDEHNINANLQL